MQKVLLKSVRQKVWDWPAVLNFILGGAGCGFYLIASLAAVMHPGKPASAPAAGFQIVAPGMIALGLIAVAIEAGRPARGRYLLHHLSSSWMSAEVLAGMAFIFLAVINFFLPRPVFIGAAVVAAIWLLIAQGFMLYRCRAVIAWNVSLIPVQLLTSSLCLGFGFWLIWTAAQKAHFSLLILIVGLSLLFINSLIWVSYLVKHQDESFHKATQPLREALPLTISLGFGSGLAALFVIFLILGLTFRLESIYLQRLAIFAGAVILGAGAYQKAVIVLKANYLRELTAGK